mmetsp:Transcript_15735/g.30402  ORF Transcript_15735/g.30402 Transcript_15735/m.30402 type:complete len:210 (+) Transcript_15735:1454-2083(+)
MVLPSVLFPMLSCTSPAANGLLMNLTMIWNMMSCPCQRVMAVLFLLAPFSTSQQPPCHMARQTPTTLLQTFRALQAQLAMRVSCVHPLWCFVRKLTQGPACSSKILRLVENLLFFLFWGGGGGSYKLNSCTERGKHQYRPMSLTLGVFPALCLPMSSRPVWPTKSLRYTRICRSNIARTRLIWLFFPTNVPVIYREFGYKARFVAPNTD